MSAVAATLAAAPALPTARHRPLLGVAAVLMGAFIASINVRLTTVGLADMRGGLALGFDEGSWFATAFAASQLAVAVSSAWFSVMLGPRRFLLWSSTIFCLASALPPLIRDPELLIALQIVRGMAVGTFIPATIGFILHALPPRWWVFGLAAYSFRFVFSQNIPDSIEAFYGEHGLWAWIFWQNTALTPIMIALIWFGMPREPAKRALLRQGDWAGIVFVGLGLTLIFAALDQGNRLDWFNSGIIIGMLTAGSLLLVAFIVNAFLIDRPLIDFSVLARRNFLIAALMIAINGFGITATSFILPSYLLQIQGLRAQQISDVLDWIALPQLVLVPLVAWLLRYIDARLLMATGWAFIAIGSWMNTGLTHDWVGENFKLSQLFEATGQALSITSTIFFVIANITPAQAATVAAMIQVSRLLGAEVAVAFMQTFVRVREQIHSNLTGLNLSAGDGVAERVTNQLSQMFANRMGGADDGLGQSLLTLGQMVRREAFVLAYIDGFWVVAWVLAASIVLLLFLTAPPPNPLTPPRVPPAQP